MDATHLKSLLETAISQGFLTSDALTGIDDHTRVESRETRIRELLGTYRRRLKHTGGNETLLAQTQDLVQVLETYPEQSLRMVFVYPAEGFSRLFLANLNESKVFHWMRMFDGIL